MADVINVTPEVNPESPEYIAEMAAKGSAAVNGGVEPEAPVVIAPKPEGVPDKFYNAETGEVDYASLTKSYVELEKSKSKPPEPPKVEPKADDKTPPAEDAANKAVADAGLDMTSLSAEYAESGELSKESYDKLAKAGIPNDMVDNYIEGQLAKVEVMRTQAYTITEGSEGYTAMVDWAKANATPEEIKAYNIAVNSNIPTIREYAIKDMWTKYGNDSGNTGKDLITGKVNTKVGSNAYQSRAEMMVDMNDPKYKTDPAFRAKVSEKLGRSNIF